VNPCASDAPYASFVTCVSDFEIYQEYVADSLEKALASDPSFERIPVDNRDGRYSAAQALNLGLKQAKGELVVFCHQDVGFPSGWLSKLRSALESLDRQKISWGVVGPAGRCADESYAGNVIVNGKPWYFPPLPRPVMTLDELCLVIRRDSGLQFDETFDHFHLYGADLCLEASRRGMQNMVLDCCLVHLSGGDRDLLWRQQKEKFILKWWPMRKTFGNKIFMTSGTIRLHSPFVRWLRKLAGRVKGPPS
jgi:glycosyltransferase involved in cell wall biosynthesis